jgi:hypothetical protein
MDVKFVPLAPLLQNCPMLINTILVERTIEREGLWDRLSAEDLRALTPLFHGHINPYGQFALDLNPGSTIRNSIASYRSVPPVTPYRRPLDLWLRDEQIHS